jgi:hypothetical protein
MAVADFMSRKPEDQEAPLLASVKYPLDCRDYQSLDTALFRLLYMLDGAIASAELKKGSLL